MSCDHSKTCGDCFSPDHVRHLNQTIRHMATAMAESVEWNLATLDEMMFIKSTSKSRTNRQKSICVKMLEKCRPEEVYEKIDWGTEYHPKFHRTQKILQDVRANGAGGLEGAVARWMAKNLNG